MRCFLKFYKRIICWPIRAFLSFWQYKRWNLRAFSCATNPAVSSSTTFFRLIFGPLLLRISGTFLLRLLMCGPFLFLGCLWHQLHFLFQYLTVGLSVRLKILRYCTSQFRIFSFCFYFCDDVWQRSSAIFICSSFLMIFTYSDLDSLGTCSARWVECCKSRLRP